MLKSPRRIPGTESRCVVMSVILTALVHGQDLHSHIWPYFELERPSGKWSWSVDLGLHVQGIARPDTSDDPKFYDRFRDYDDYVKHTKRPGYFAVEISRSFEKGWTILHRTEVFPNWLQSEKDIRYPQKPKDLDSHTNARGFLEKTGRNYAFKVGRDYLVWDPFWTGTLLPDQIPSFDQLRVDLWGESWYYHAFVGDMNRRDVMGNLDRYKYLSGHRLDVRLRGNLIVWIAELQLVTKALSLADLNPLFLVYHNLERIHMTHNAITSAGLRWKARKELEVSIQLDIDELEWGAFERYTANQNAFAYQVGLFHRRFGVSYARTWPWIYNHEAKRETYPSTFVFSESQDTVGAVYFDRFIGHPMGSGSGILMAKAYLIHNLEIEFRHLERTPNHILEPISALESPEPVETRNRLAISYKKEFSQRFTAVAVVSWERARNYHHTGTRADLKEWLVGIAYRFSSAE